MQHNPFIEPRHIGCVSEYLLQALILIVTLTFTTITELFYA